MSVKILSLQVIVVINALVEVHLPSTIAFKTSSAVLCGLPDFWTASQEQYKDILCLQIFNINIYLFHKN